jgi:hypothetical protein
MEAGTSNPNPKTTFPKDGKSMGLEPRTGNVEVESSNLHQDKSSENFCFGISSQT